MTDLLAHGAGEVPPASNAQGEMAGPLSAHALLVGDRLTIDRSGYSRVVSAAPFCYRKDNGYVVVFRYGALVLVGLNAAQEKEVLAQFVSEAAHTAPIEEEKLGLEIRPDEEEGVTAAGVI